MNPKLQNFLLGRLANLEPCLAFDQVITYHGTRTSALQSIRDNGILSHPFKHYHPSRFYKADRGASVYLTENPNIAAQWALSEVNDPSLATILQVVVPKEGLRPDEEAPEAERFVGDIPPEWIQATYSLNPDGSLGQPVPFHADPRLSQSVEDATKTKRFMVIKHSSPGWSIPSFDAEFKESEHPRDQSGKFSISPLTHEEHSAVKEYQGALVGSEVGGYTNLQGMLRHGKPNFAHVWNDEVGKKHLDNLNKAFEKSVVNSPMTVHRGELAKTERHPSGKPYRKLLDADIGSIISDPGVFSTTTDPSKAKKFQNVLNSGEVPIHLEIKLHPGTKAIPVDQIAGKIGEKEVAVAPNTKFRVVSKRKSGQGFKMVLESVPEKKGDAAMDAALGPLRQWMLERFVERAPVMAMDRSTFSPLKSESSSIAMDRGPTARKVSEDGHLHVAISNISKATVNPYWGKEIPNWQELGLDPEKKYMLLRDPKELEKGAHTFNNLPILAEHVPINAVKHPAHLVVGSTGTDAKYSHPFLKNSLVFWTKPAIDAIEGDEQKELSCAYHYDPDMTPGVYEGQKYDGVMRNIRGNHVAQVKDGRAGADVVVQDEAFKEKEFHMPKISPAALVARGALLAYMAPRLAQDAKFDYDAVVKDVTSKNFKEQKQPIIDAVTAGAKDKLAKDADISDLANLLDALSPHAEQADAMTLEPNSAIPTRRTAGEDDVDPEDTVSKIKAYLEEQGVSPEILANLDAFLAEPANPDPDTPTPGEDEELDEEGKPKNKAEDGVIPEQQKNLVTTGAMDAAIKKAVAAATKDATDRTLKTQREIRTAERFVRPWVGELAMDAACPADVYRTTLKALGMDSKRVDDLHEDALLPVLEAQPKPSRQHQRDTKIAQDANLPKETFAERFPFMKNVTVQ